MGHAVPARGHRIDAAREDMSRQVFECDLDRMPRLDIARICRELFDRKIPVANIRHVEGRANNAFSEGTKEISTSW
jgi:hypothetical protein